MIFSGVATHPDHMPVDVANRAPDENITLGNPIGLGGKITYLKTATNAASQTQQYQHKFILSSFSLPREVHFRIPSSDLAVQSKLAIRPTIRRLTLGSKISEDTSFLTFIFGESAGHISSSPVVPFLRL